jgi:hypothetical protein
MAKKRAKTPEPEAPTIESTPEPVPQNAILAINDYLKATGLPEIDVVDPKDCIPQAVNARYMDRQTLDNLTKNLKRDKRLESVPLVHRIDGKFAIISGHHRIEAAKKAGLNRIIVMITEPQSPDEVRAKQLSHNAIVGKDDEVLLKKLYESIKDLDLKFYSGLQDQLAGFQVTSISFRAGSYQEFTLAFLPEEVESFDKAAEIAEQLKASPSAAVRLTPLPAYETFMRALRKVKKVEDIKSNGAAIMRLIEIAFERLKEVEDGETKQTA